MGRYGQKLRKQVKAFEILQRTKYTCPFCGKASVRRHSVGIWNCKACRRSVAGGAWEYSTSAQTAKTTINRLKKLMNVKDDVVMEFAEEEKTDKKKGKKSKKADK